MPKLANTKPTPQSKAKQEKPANKAKAKPDAKTADAVPTVAGKTALVVNLLQRKEGVSIVALSAATGWLPHSARAALTGLRKKGHVIARGKAEDGTTVYRIVKAA